MGGNWFMDLLSTVTKDDTDKLQKELDSAPKGKFQYRVFEEKTFWRWWASLSSLGVTIVSTKTFVSKELALADMRTVFTTFGMEIKK